MHGERLPGVMRGVPPCKDCKERNTACWDKCQQYQAWKTDTARVKEARRTYEEERYKAYKEQKRRAKWVRRTF